MEFDIFTRDEPAPRLIRISGALREFSFEELVQHSAMILRGEVNNERTQTHLGNVGTYEGFPMLFTRYAVTVESVLKPRGNHYFAPVGIWTMGGVLEALSIQVDREARLTIGERVILFLTRHLPSGMTADPDFNFTVLGGFQGKYTITDTEDGPSVTNGFTPPEPLNQFVARIRETSLSRVPA